MTTYTLKVIAIRKETEDTITLCFKQPALRKIKYLAGQYLTLVFRINGRRYIRPYSFSSAPAIDPFLEVSIKRVPNGLVSNHIHDAVAIGDSIEVMEPMGDFVINTNALPKDVFLWGVGSGITPLISLAKELLEISSSTHVRLIYGNRNHEQTIFLGLIESLLIKYPDRFSVWYFYTQLSVTATPPFLVQGRVTKQSVLDIMTVIDPEKSTHYICGPLGLKDSVRTSLLELKVPINQIFAEDFELIRDPKDFDEIQTRTVKLNFANKLYDLEVIKGKSVLESALNAGIELPYSCQTGNCSTCISKLKEGVAKMIGIEKRNDLVESEFLLCCTHPISDNVYLEIN